MWHCCLSGKPLSKTAFDIDKRYVRATADLQVIPVDSAFANKR